ncbi:hypothetical protein [Phenylobacterium sp.]|uniref:hypothetical protein n=1 Tax=Phenylobacterium sp. TaxID=1871053 RepID=UPI00393D9EAE
MTRLPFAAASFALLISAASAPLAALAQPVEVTPLAAPDAFSTPGRQTGLPQDLWRGASAETAKAVLPLLAARPLSPAAAQLARRVLATGAPGPEGVGDDPAVIGARAGALIALGDPQAAAAILQRAPGLERSPELSQAAAESALLAGDDARACAIEEALGSGRGQAYWLRLRTYCQALAGRTAEAQLTFELAQGQARDAVFGRLLGAKLSGAAPGAASLRNGLDYALSKSLGLDIAAAKPSPAVAAALAGGEVAPPAFDIAAVDSATGGLAAALATGETPPPGGLSALIAAAAEAEPKAGAGLQGAALLLVALSPDLPARDRGRLAAFALAGGKAPAGRLLALDQAADGKLAGEAALLSLWIAADAGTAGPALGDRVRIVRALARAGLSDDARAFALEGLAGLK